MKITYRFSFYKQFYQLSLPTKLFEKDMKSDKFVIVSNRVWNQKISERLESRLGGSFMFFHRQEDLEITRLEEISPKYIFFPHWSYRIPEEIFQNFECVIFHMTDLPFGRGGSPLQNLIKRQIYETQITALQCVKDLDAGPIYLKHPLSLYGSAEEIFIRASRIIETMIFEIITQCPKPIEQEGKSVTFKRRKPSESNLLDLETLEQVFDQIRMLDAEGYPHAFIEVGKLRFEFTRASLKTANVLADVKISLVEDR